MRSLLFSVVIFAFGCVLILPGIAYETSYEIPGYTVDETTLPDVSARAWGVFDTDTDKLLFGHDVRSVHAIASVTKLMTAKVALAAEALEATTTLSRQAIATEGRAGGLAAGEVLSIRELLFPLLLSSSNDAAEAIAGYRDNRETFIATMNTTAQTLGMTSTVYADPSGLSPASVSSVADLAKLIAYLVRKEPYLLDISRLRNYVGAHHIWQNVDKVASVDTFRGGKHGYTDEAGRTLAAVFEEELARGGKRDVTIVLLGSDNLQADVKTLRAFLHEYVAYAHEKESSVTIDTSAVWKLPTLRYIENIARALLPTFAAKSQS